MTRLKFWKQAFAIVCLTHSLAITSCDDNNDPANTLKFNPDKVELAPETTATVEVKGATSTLSVESSDSKIVTASVKDNIVTLTGVAEGEATVTVTDKQNASGNISVTVKAADNLLFDKNSLELSVDEDATVSVKDGKSPYEVTVTDESIASVSVKGNEITVKGLKAGTTTILVTDSNKKTGKITIAVK